MSWTNVRIGAMSQEGVREGSIRVGVCLWRIVCRWVAKSGGRLRLPKDCEGVEVSPTVSYSGEGLRSVCRGRTFRQQHDIFLQVPAVKFLVTEMEQPR